MIVDAELGMPLDLGKWESLWEEGADDSGEYLRIYRVDVELMCVFRVSFCVTLRVLCSFKSGSAESTETGSKRRISVVRSLKFYGYHGQCGECEWDLDTSGSCTLVEEDGIH